MCSHDKILARVHHVVAIPVLEGGGNSDGRREMVDLAMNGVIFFAIVNYTV